MYSANDGNNNIPNLFHKCFSNMWARAQDKQIVLF